MAKKDSFILYTDQKAVLDKLTDEQAGKLIKAIYEYVETGNMPELDNVIDLVITPFKTILDKDKAKYEEVSKARAEAGSKGGKTKISKSKQKKQLQTKESKASNCDDNDNDNEYDNDINKLNEFNLYNNFEQNLQCDCISKSTGEKCNRRSTYSINEKNYCNQHSRPIIREMLEKSDKKKKYGENGNVKITDEEFEKVKAYFPNDYMERIQSLDDYIQSTGKKYKDFFATLKTWARKDGYKPPTPKEEPKKEEFIAIDTSQLTPEEYGKYVRGELTTEELIKKGRIHV